MYEELPNSVVVGFHLFDNGLTDIHRDEFWWFGSFAWAYGILFARRVNAARLARN
jgi:hypothetical protein